jgi:hypothetical protein
MTFTTRAAATRPSTLKTAPRSIDLDLCHFPISPSSRSLATGPQTFVSPTTPSRERKSPKTSQPVTFPLSFMPLAHTPGFRLVLQHQGPFAPGLPESLSRPAASPPGSETKTEGTNPGSAILAITVSNIKSIAYGEHKANGRQTYLLSMYQETRQKYTKKRLNRDQNRKKSPASRTPGADPFLPLLPVSDCNPDRRTRVTEPLAIVSPSLYHRWVNFRSVK